MTPCTSVVDLQLYIRGALSDVRNKLELGTTMVNTILRHHGRLGLFARTFSSYSSLHEGTKRVRDVLPLPVPSLAETFRWHRARGEDGRRRLRHRDVAAAVAREAWTFVVIILLNYEYTGRLSDAGWFHKEQLSEAQQRAVNLIVEAVGVYTEDATEPFESIDWDALAAKVSFDYSGGEVERALPLRLPELRPGLPEANVAAKLDAVAHVDKSIRRWLLNPRLVLKPEAEWPDEPPVARV